MPVQNKQIKMVIFIAFQSITKTSPPNSHSTCDTSLPIGKIQRQTLTHSRQLSKDPRTCTHSSREPLPVKIVHPFQIKTKMDTADSLRGLTQRGFERAALYVCMCTRRSGRLRQPVVYVCTLEDERVRMFDWTVGTETIHL